MEMNKLRDFLSKYKGKSKQDTNLNNKNANQKSKKDLNIANNNNNTINTTNNIVNINNMENYIIDQEKKTNKHLLKILYNHTKTENNKRNKIDTLTLPNKSKENGLNDSVEKVNEETDIFQLKANFQSYLKNCQSKNLSETPKRVRTFNSVDAGENENIIQINMNEENANLRSTGITEDKIKILTNCDVIVKSISRKVNDLRLDLIKDDLKLRIDLKEFEKHLDKFLHFLGGDIFTLMKSCKLINDWVKNYLTKQSEIIIENFNKTYKESFEVIQKKIIIQNMKNKSKVFVNNYLAFIADLQMKCKIKMQENFYGNTFIIPEISKCIGDKKSFKNIYKFDYEPKNIRKKIWITRELANFHEDELNKAYVQPILPFSCNDEFEITINLISGRGFLDVTSLRWLNLKSIPTKKLDCINYNQKNNNNKDIVNYDLSRICEMEILKHNWVEFSYNNIINYLNPFKKVNNTTTHYSIDLLTKEIKGLVSPYFTIKKVFYDDMGFLLIKIFLQAVKEGAVEFNEDLGINLVVVNEDKPLVNEIKKNGLIFDRSNTLQIRKNDEIVIYISRNK